MTQPTQAQIEAGMDIIERLQSKSLRTPEYDAETMDLAKSEIERLRALTAAAQVGEQDDLAIRYGMQSGGDLWKATIERCAQVADDLAVDDPDGWCKLVAAAIRKLKDAP